MAGLNRLGIDLDTLLEPRGGFTKIADVGIQINNSDISNLYAGSANGTAYGSTYYLKQNVDIGTLFAAKGTVTITGDLYRCGRNNSYQLADGTNISDSYTSSSIDKLGSISNANVLAASSTTTAVITTNGNLYTWGTGTSGQLGLGSAITVSSTPALVSSGWSKVACGYYHTVGIKTDGSLWTWGRNDYGQLGNGTSGATNVTTPTRIGTATDWKEVSCGQEASLAIKTNGTLWSWGRASRAQLGNGTTSPNVVTPTQVGTITTWRSISAGPWHTSATRTDNTRWAWGMNTSNRLGNTSLFPVTSPVQIGTTTDWKEVSCGFEFTVGIKINGTLWTNGMNYLDSSLGTPISVPTQLGTNTDYDIIAAGFYHLATIKTNKTLWAWGSNTWGQLGYSTPSAAIISGLSANEYVWRTPAPVTSSTTFNKVYSNSEITLAIT